MKERMHFFAEKYGEKVKVYTIGVLRGLVFKRSMWWSSCNHTGIIGSVRIIKQEKIGSGIIRIYAVLGN